MKSLVQFKEMSAPQRLTTLKTTATRATTAKKEISKILLAAEMCGDFGEGGMNAYAQDATGIELRRELQGTYEAVNVLREIQSGKLAMTEEEFDSKKFGSYPLIALSGFMSKSPEKVALALAIIREGDKVTEKLKALRDGIKAKKEKPSKESKDSEGGETEVTEIQTQIGKTFFVPEGTAILNEPTLLRALVEEIAAADSIESCQAYHGLFKDLTAKVHARWEVLEAETAAQTPQEVAA